MFEEELAGDATEVAAVLAALGRVSCGSDNGGRIDLIHALERVKAVAASVQARVTAAFVREEESIAAEWRRRGAAAADDYDAWRAARDEERRHCRFDGDRDAVRQSRRRHRDRRDRIGVDAQVALARRESPSQASRHVSMALALVDDLPHTLAALESGSLSEWRAGLVVRETQVLDRDLRRAADAELAAVFADDGVGDRELVRRVRAVTYRLDAASVAARVRAAEADRRVTSRPAPDVMCYVTALLPVAHGVALHAALIKAAATAKAAGDERTKGQIMADELVCRVTGQSHAQATPVEVQLVVSDKTLLCGDDLPATVPGYGTVPASWARDLVAQGVDDPATAAARWVRRLYTHPEDGTLVAMESGRRLFEGGLRRFVVARDGTCATPWCDAPVSQVDHVVDFADGGPTSVANSRGTCVRCNLVKQAAGWRARTLAPFGGMGPAAAGGYPGHERSSRHTVELTTPTAHRYVAGTPPVLPGDRPPRGRPARRRPKRRRPPRGGVPVRVAVRAVSPLEEAYSGSRSRRPIKRRAVGVRRHA